MGDRREDQQRRAFAGWCNAVMATGTLGDETPVVRESLEACFKDNPWSLYRMVLGCTDGGRYSFEELQARGTLRRSQSAQANRLLGSGPKEDEFQKMRPPKNPFATRSMMEACLKFVQADGVHLENTGVGDLQDGNTRIVFGLIFSLIRRYQLGADMQNIGDVVKFCTEQIQHVPGLEDSEVRFPSTFATGHTFAALVERFAPGNFDMSHYDESQAVANMQRAFDVAEEKLGVASFLDAGEVAAAPEQQSIMTYVGMFRKLAEGDVPEPVARQEITPEMEEKVATLIEDQLAFQQQVLSQATSSNGDTSNGGSIYDAGAAAASRTQVVEKLREAGLDLYVQDTGDLSTFLARHPKRFVQSKDDGGGDVVMSAAPPPPPAAPAAPAAPDVYPCLETFAKSVLERVGSEPLAGNAGSIEEKKHICSLVGCNHLLSSDPSEDTTVRVPPEKTLTAVMEVKDESQIKESAETLAAAEAATKAATEAAAATKAELEAAIAELEQARSGAGEAAEQGAQLSALQAKFKASEEQVEDLSAKLAASEAQASDLQAAVASGDKKAVALGQDMASARAELETAQAALASAKVDMERLQASSKEQAAEMLAKLSASEGEARSALEQIATAELLQKEAQAAHARELKRLESELEAKDDEISVIIQAKEAKALADAETIAQLQQELEKAKSDFDLAHDTIEALNLTLESIQDTLEHVRNQQEITATKLYVVQLKREQERAVRNSKGLPKGYRDIPAPSGCVTLAFTDVQDSTKQWEAYPETMAAALKVHNQTIREQIARFSGYEVKTEGDAFMVAFSNSFDAVSWAINVQYALAEADWPKDLVAASLEPQAIDGAKADEKCMFRGLRVRTGMHTGEPSGEIDPVTGRMDYFGRMVNKSARIEGLASGGCIVITADIFSQIESRLSELNEIAQGEVFTENMGKHELKGVPGETETWLVLHPRQTNRSTCECVEKLKAGGPEKSAGSDSASKDLRAENDKLAAQLAAVQNALDEARAAMAAFEEGQHGKSAESESSKEKKPDKSDPFAQLSKELEELRAKNAALEKDLTDSETLGSQLERENNNLMEKEEAVRSDLETARHAVDAAHAELANAREKEARANETIDSLTETIEMIQETLRLVQEQQDATAAKLKIVQLKREQEREASDTSSLPEGYRDIPAPSGTVTLAFTDVQDSTKQWEAYPETMAAALKVHNQTIREQISQFQGYEVKTEGDAFMVAFADEFAAMAWAVSVQFALAEADWPKDLVAASLKPQAIDGAKADEKCMFRGLRVRTGMHTGEPSGEIDPVTGRMDYFGRMVNKSARIEGLASGGCIVITTDIFDQVKDRMDEISKMVNGPVFTENMGKHELKGVPGETETWLVLHPRQTNRSKCACVEKPKAGGHEKSDDSAKVTSDLQAQNEELSAKLAAAQQALEEAQTALASRDGDDGTTPQKKVSKMEKSDAPDPLAQLTKQLQELRAKNSELDRALAETERTGMHLERDNASLAETHDSTLTELSRVQKDLADALAVPVPPEADAFPPVLNAALWFGAGTAITYLAESFRRTSAAFP